MFLTVLSFLRGSFFLSIKKSRSSLIYQKPEAQFFFQMFLIFRKSEARVIIKLFFKKRSVQSERSFWSEELISFLVHENCASKGHYTPLLEEYIHSLTLFKTSILSWWEMGFIHGFSKIGWKLQGIFWKYNNGAIAA